MAKKISLLLILAALLLVPSFANAQGPVRFENLRIDLWPEYDEPAVLVIYRATLSDDVQLPVDLQIRIPAAVGEPNAVAVSQEGGQPFNAEYQRLVSGEWAIISFSSPFRDVQIEYYDANIDREGNTRQFKFVWPGDYAVENVQMLVQQPTGAQNITTFPRLSSNTQDSFGVSYYGGDIGSVAAGESFEMTITYDKQTDDLTVNFLPIDSSEPVSVNTTGRLSLTEMFERWGWLLGLLVFMIGVGWYWFTVRNHRPPARGRKRRPTNRRVMEPELNEMENDAVSIFCHQCGKRAMAGDKFCRACGTKLRAG